MKKKVKIKKRKLTYEKDDKIRIGRPKLQHSTMLTDEMENVAQLTRQGKSADQIADIEEISIERVLLYLHDTPIVMERIKELFEDKAERFTLLRDSIFESCMRRARKMINDGELNTEQLDKWMRRYDPYELEKIAIKRTEVKRQRRVEETDKPVGSVFKELEVEKDIDNSDDKKL